VDLSNLDSMNFSLRDSGAIIDPLPLAARKRVPLPTTVYAQRVRQNLTASAGDRKPQPSNARLPDNGKH
jgi:hypothetical protein